ncbi:uncharacterized protein LOC115874608 [Sitophilus oryzae]|uniref:Uncharacterized protein LOC115874608 n=1 Tax=Sitophilus oryzae TaxID=7048 RepID=A0A6J2X3U3_SITOR|nr:uncharacterized protein LOC115874608 [Sitophilus oryzae]
MRENVTLSNLNIEISGSGNSYRRHIVCKISIGIIEFLLSSLLYCYGIIFCEYVLLGKHKYEEGVFTAILFVVCWSFTDPISRFISEYFEDRKQMIFRCLVGFSVAILFCCVAIPNNIVLYMIFGGIVSNLISTQLRWFAVDKLDMDSRIFEVIRQVSRALSLILMPHFIFCLVEIYGINQVKLIYGSILFNIIPAALLIKTYDKVLTREHDLEYPIDRDYVSRYQTIGRYSQQMNDLLTNNRDQAPNSSSSSESSEDNSIFDQQPIQESKQLDATGSTQESLGHHMYDHSEESPYEFDNFAADAEQINDLERQTTYLNPVNVQYYFQNAGVSILPGIPEENEDEDDDDINYINPKRLSRISVKLEELNIQDQIRKDSVKDVFTITEVVHENRPESIDRIEFIPNFESPSFTYKIEDFNKAKNCFRCSAYKKFVWTRRLRSTKDFFVDNLLRPLYYAIKNLYFYPSVTTKTIGNLVSTLYITLAPFMVINKGFSSEEATFLLTYIAFAWGFFLVGLPMVIKLNPTRMRMMLVFGLMVSGSSFLLLSVKLSNDVITFSSLLFGFGYGLISYSEKIVYRSSIGMRAWYHIQGPLEVLSAVFIIIIYLVIYIYRVDLKILLFMASISYFVNAFLWLCIPLVKFSIDRSRRFVYDVSRRHEEILH